MFDRRDYMREYMREYQRNRRPENPYKARFENEIWTKTYYKIEISPIINKIEKEGFINGSKC